MNTDKNGWGSSVFTYNKNGGLSQTERIKNVSMTPPELFENRREKFYYNNRGLMNKYSYTKQYAEWFTEECWPELSDNKRTEWGYWYNPLGEREQKRMLYSPAGDKNGSVYPWTYYLLGINNEQYVVYNGFQISDPTYKISALNSCATDVVPPTSKTFLYPTEYNIYGSNSKIPVTYVVNANGNWQKNFKVFDHLGSVRTVISSDGTLVGEYHYEPFGAKLDVSEGSDRLSYIGKEKDKENNLGDHGVRKYDYETGRFNSIDPLFEKFYGWSPYQYSGNNPIWAKDWNGKFIFSVHNEAIVESGRGNLAYATLNFFYNDVLNIVGNDDKHFDNKQNYDEVMEVINKAGGFNKLDDHTIGDFNAHSNYVDIWNELSEKGEVSGEIPTFNNMSSYPVFKAALENGLRTTNYPDNGKDPYGHNDGYTTDVEGNQVGKNGEVIKKFSAKDDDKSKGPFEEAKEVYIRSLMEKVNEEVNKEN